jgi:hypothetical protein
MCLGASAWYTKWAFFKYNRTAEEQFMSLQNISTSLQHCLCKIFLLLNENISKNLIYIQDHLQLFTCRFM